MANKMRCNKCGKNLELHDLTHSFVIFGKNCMGFYKGNNLGEAAKLLNLNYVKLYDHAAKGLPYIGRWDGHRVVH